MSLAARTRKRGRLYTIMCLGTDCYAIEIQIFFKENFGKNNKHSTKL